MHNQQASPPRAWHLGSCGLIALCGLALAGALRDGLLGRCHRPGNRRGVGAGGHDVGRGGAGLEQRAACGAWAGNAAWGVRWRRAAGAEHAQAAGGSAARRGGRAA